MREKTNLTLHPTVKKAGIRLAEADGRSLSELVERLLEEHIAQHSGNFPVDAPFTYHAPATPVPATRSTASYRTGERVGGVALLAEEQASLPPSAARSLKRSKK